VLVASWLASPKVPAGRGRQGRLGGRQAPKRHRFDGGWAGDGFRPLLGARNGRDLASGSSRQMRLTRWPGAGRLGSLFNALDCGGADVVKAG